jgi:hypothetical protein
MKFMIAAACLIAISQSAVAQQGVSNKRNMYGNLVRDGESPSWGGVNQATPTAGGAIRNAPIQPAINAAKPTQATR